MIHIGIPIFVVACFLQVDAKCYTSISGITMTNSSLSTFEVSNFSDCFDKCKQHDKCRSINYFMKTTLCQLNKMKISDKPENKIDDESSVYMDNPDATGNYFFLNFFLIYLFLFFVCFLFL